MVALANAMRDGVRISKPAPLVVQPFASVVRDVGETGEVEDATVAEKETRESDSEEASSEDFADAEEALNVEQGSDGHHERSEEDFLWSPQIELGCFWRTEMEPWGRPWITKCVVFQEIQRVPGGSLTQTLFSSVVQNIAVARAGATSGVCPEAPWRR